MALIVSLTLTDSVPLDIILDITYIVIALSIIGLSVGARCDREIRSDRVSCLGLDVSRVTELAETARHVSSDERGDCLLRTK